MMRATNPKGQYPHGQQVDSLRTVTTYADICVAIVDDDESFCRSVRRRLPRFCVRRRDRSARRHVGARDAAPAYRAWDLIEGRGSATVSTGGFDER